MPLMPLMLLAACVSTEEINFSVEADVPFIHEEEVNALLEGFTIMETDVPDGLEITEEEIDLVVFNGTLGAGEYEFQLDFEHYGDVSFTKKSRWNVAILSE